MVQFKRADFSAWVVSRPGRHKTVTNPKIIDQIHELNLEDHRISAISITEQLAISRDRIGSIIHESYDMRNLSSKCVQKWILGLKTSLFLAVWTNFGNLWARNK